MSELNTQDENSSSRSPVINSGESSDQSQTSSVLGGSIFCLEHTSGGPPQSPRRIEITAKRFAYDPDVIALKRGEPVVLVLHSVDVTHGLKIADFNINSEDIKKGKDTANRRSSVKLG
jgi:hypothetical protein